MNGFKLGHTALGLSAQKYIVEVNAKKPFEPQCHSVVLFPKSYQQLYGLDSSIAKCFQECFSLKGSTFSEVTIWDVTCKKEKE